MVLKVNKNAIPSSLLPKPYRYSTGDTLYNKVIQGVPYYCPGWSMSERIRSSYDDALYKSTYTLLYFTLLYFAQWRHSLWTRVDKVQGPPKF